MIDYRNEFGLTFVEGEQHLNNILLSLCTWIHSWICIIMC